MSVSISGQINRRLSFGFDAGIVNDQMRNVTDRMNDASIYSPFNFFEENTFDIARISSFELSLNYQVFKLLNIGIYGSYQFCETTGDFWFVLNESDPPIIHDSIFLTTQYNIQSFSYGVSVELIFNEMKFWNKTKSLNKWEALWSSSVGIGIASLSRSNFINHVEPTIGSFFKSYGFQISSSLKIGYLIFDNKFVSSAGLLLGTQYFKTDYLRTEIGNIIPEDFKTQLDFTGLLFGAYLTIGK